jgi:hypothetical protein
LNSVSKPSSAGSVMLAEVPFSDNAPILTISNYTEVTDNTAIPAKLRIIRRNQCLTNKNRSTIPFRL